MLDLLLPIMVGILAALGMLGLVRKSRAMLESDDGRSLATVVASRSAGFASRSAEWAREMAATGVHGLWMRRPARPARSSRWSRWSRWNRWNRPRPKRSDWSEKPERPAEALKPEPGWVRVAGPQVWRDHLDIGCQQCATSWELGMKTCIRCGRRLADVFTAGGR